MANVLVIGDNLDSILRVETALRDASISIVTASSERKVLEFLATHHVQLVVADLFLNDMAGVRRLREINQEDPHLNVLIVANRESIEERDSAVRCGAAGVRETPVRREGLLTSVSATIATRSSNDLAYRVCDLQAHAAARWARAVVSMIDAPKDPRTIKDWSLLAFAAAGTLRNWSRTAGIAPRKSLLFGRLLRTVYLSEDGRHRPENLLDIVDLRTLRSVMKCAGFKSVNQFPTTIEDFLAHQLLVTDADCLIELGHAIEVRRRQSLTSAHAHDATAKNARGEFDTRSSSRTVSRSR